MVVCTDCATNAALVMDHLENIYAEMDELRSQVKALQNTAVMMLLEWQPPGEESVEITVRRLCQMGQGDYIPRDMIGILGGSPRISKRTDRVDVDEGGIEITNGF